MDRITRKIVQSVEIQNELDRLYREDSSKSGEIRPLTDAEVQNLPSHMILLSVEEEQLLKNFPQNERANIYHMWRMLGSGESFAEFLKDILNERRRFDECRKSC